MESAGAVVLVVDDDPQIRSVFSDYLRHSFDVRTAESGAEALAEMDDHVDVVLLDRRMPGMTGGDLLERFRADGYDQPVAMVTAVEPDFDVLEMGFDSYVVKPVFEEELRDVVETMLLRREFDAVIREYFSLASKVAALKQGKAPSELDDHAGYGESTARLEQIKREARAGLEVAIETGKFDELFRHHVQGETDVAVEAAGEEPDGQAR